jgi:deazaflavin-dependent oxidoreductase (nitroreductase family)
MPSPRPPLLALVHRFPLWLDRIGIRGYERLLGIDWLVLTTRGRRTGAPRTVVLDVVGHDPSTDTWYVQPADGRRSHWLRNLRAHPVATVAVHGRRFTAEATDVTGPEGAEVVLRFIRTHPLYARLVVWLVGYVDRIDVPDAALRTQLRDVPVVALRPRDRGDREPRRE